MKKIGAEMILSYALVKRDEVKISTLIKIKETLQNEIEDLLIKLTLSDICNAVGSNSHLFDTRGDQFDFVIVKASNSEKAFDLNYLNRCYSPFFDESDFSKITQILLG